MSAALTPEYIAKLCRMTGAQKLRTAFQMYWGGARSKPPVSASSIPTGRRTWGVQQRVKEIFMHAVT